MACRPGEAIETTECCGRNEAERRETAILLGEPGTRRRIAADDHAERRAAEISEKPDNERPWTARRFRNSNRRRAPAPECNRHNANAEER